MSDGRDKLNDFSLLKSLVGGKSIKDKTDRLRKAHANAKSKESADQVDASAVEAQGYAKRPTNHQHSSSLQPQTRQARVNQQRTPFRMPQYGQKQHVELVVEAPEGNQEEVITVNIDLAKERQKEEQRLFKWLCQRFPKCFDPKNKKPVKIGISEDIEIIYQNEHFAPVDQYVLKNVIKRYVGDTRYQRSVLQYKQRFNLFGKPVEDFSAEHLSYAQKRLDEIAEKAHLRAQGIDIKTYYQEKRAEEQSRKEQQQAAENTQTSSDIYADKKLEQENNAPLSGEQITSKESKD